MKHCCFWAWLFAACILGASAWAPAQVVINEVAYDPDGDLSGNGTVSETGDEFIELYNAGGASVDLSGWDVGDTNSSARLTFPEGTTLEPGRFLTVFRDSDPGLPGQVFGGAAFQLSNSGERVELRNAQDEVVDWTDDGGVTTNEAWEREPDGTGTFLRASRSVNNPETRFTPGASNLRGFQPPERLTVHFLDVGQGDSTLIVSPSGTTVLIDGGDNGMGTAVIVPYLRSLGIDGLTKTLDYMIATHFDGDHIGGLDEVAAAIPPLTAYDRGGDNLSITPAFTNYVDSIAGVRQSIALGQTLDLGAGATLQALCKGEDLASAGEQVESLIYPAGRVAVDSDNENELSIALKLSWGGFQLSVAGDLTGGGLNSDDVEGDLATALGDIDVYQVNHHASLTSSSERFLRTIQPEVAVISVGTNEYGHPTQTIIDRIQSVAGAQVYQTETGSGGLGDFIVGGTLVLRTDGWTYSLEGDSFKQKLMRWTTPRAKAEFFPDRWSSTNCASMAEAWTNTSNCGENPD
jgi:beta-lactamase superfamily II metal-dependent hydrolase